MARRPSIGLALAQRLALILALAVAGPAPAAEGTVYGTGVSRTEVVEISALLDHPEAYVGKTVRVQGLVTDVCPRRGCWIDIAGDREFEKLRLKVDDGVIVFPMEVKGKRVVAEGVFTKIDLTRGEALEQARRHAEERGETFDPARAGDVAAAVYQIQGTGAVVR